MASRLSRLRTVLILAVGIVLTGLGILAYVTDALEQPELDMVDARFSIRDEDPPPDDLVVVKIDDVTFDTLEMRWPFPRSLHGKVIDQIVADKPKAIGYDVQFSEASEDFDSDLALAEAVAGAKGRIALATTEVNEKGEGKFLGGPQAVLEEDLGARFGNGLFPYDEGGVIRRTSHSIDGMETLGVATVEAGTGKQVDPGPADSEEGAWIDYLGPPNTIKSVSFSRVANGRTPKGFFRDKYVIVGPTAPSLQDVHPTSISGEQMSGAEIQANALDTVRAAFPLTSAPDGLNIALIVLLGLAAPVASLRFSPLRALALALGIGVVFTVAAQLAFNADTVLAFVYPVGTLVAVSIAVLALHYLTVAFERERVRDLFARFVPEDVVDDVIDRADGLRLGGVQREGTVIFSDLRGFTSFAEKMPVDQVIDILNRYLTEMSDAILNHGGTLVAYMGDGIMAVFGAPVEQPDHADRALAAAREMIGPRLDRFNDYLRGQGLGEGFRMGVGLNSGQVMSGNVGSERRLEYTAIGDTTNTAARLEGMTKGTPHMLFAAESTVDLMKERPADLVFVDEFEVRGRQAKIRLWSLADGAEPAEA